MSKYILVSDTDNNQQLVYQDTGIKIVQRFKIGTKVRITNADVIRLLKKYVFALDTLDYDRIMVISGTFVVMDYEYTDTDGLVYIVKSEHHEDSFPLIDEKLEKVSMYYRDELHNIFSNIFSRLSDYKHMDHRLSDKEMNEANTLLTIIKKLINNDSVLKRAYGIIQFDMGEITKESLYGKCNGIYHDILDQFQEGKKSFDVGYKIICTYQDSKSLNKNSDIKFVSISAAGYPSWIDDYMIVRTKMIQEFMQTGGTVISNFNYEGSINYSWIVVKINGFEDYALKICNPEKYCIIRR